jgi:hypothetical protein
VIALITVRIIAVVLALFGLFYLGFAWAAEEAERGYVDPPIVIAFFAMEDPVTVLFSKASTSDARRADRQTRVVNSRCSRPLRHRSISDSGASRDLYGTNAPRDSADSEMIGQQGQGRESKGRGEDQLSAVGHDSPPSVRALGKKRGDRSMVGRGMSRPSRCQGVTHSMASSNVVNTPTADPST